MGAKVLEIAGWIGVAVGVVAAVAILWMSL
jgi:hypothetical protein